jgi:chemotaxis protein methyltransferase CheR
MSDPVVDAATRLLSTRLGFTASCLRAEKVATVLATLRAEGMSDQAVLEDLSRGRPHVADRFEEMVVVGETFFFREQCHFDLVLSEVLPAFFASGRGTLRVWSAGCATGEEAWSLSALLLPHLQARQRGLWVMGTDVSGRSIATARAGVYGRWSTRPSAPQPVPVFEPGSGELRTVRAPLREVTHFEVQNLLTPSAAMADFDVIFCRNVLVYFEPAAARRVCAELTRRLTAEGLATFGPMDLPAPPEGAERVGAPEWNAWRRTPPPATRTQPRPKGALPVPVSPAPLDLSVVPLHLRALWLLEHGDWAEAQRVLEEANRLVPEYLPALLERALLHERQGARTVALALMHELLESARGLEGLVFGPDALPAQYYRSTAEVFLSRVEGRP